MIDINECTLGTHNCHTSATCTNIPGSFNCTCKIGYSGNGTFCQGLFIVIIPILQLINEQKMKNRY